MHVNRYSARVYKPNMGALSIVKGWTKHLVALGGYVLEVQCSMREFCTNLITWHWHGVIANSPLLDASHSGQKISFTWIFFSVFWSEHFLQAVGQQLPTPGVFSVIQASIHCRCLSDFVIQILRPHHPLTQASSRTYSSLIQHLITLHQLLTQYLSVISYSCLIMPHQPLTQAS